MNEIDISICIPCYEMGGVGNKYLEENLNKLLLQNFKNFEVIIADQSKNDKIKLLSEKYQDQLNLKYYLNSTGKKQCAANTNYAMEKASGKIIKIIFQDDYLFSNDALLNGVFLVVNIQMTAFQFFDGFIHNITIIFNLEIIQ